MCNVPPSPPHGLCYVLLLSSSKKDLTPNISPPQQMDETVLRREHLTEPPLDDWPTH